MRGQVMFSMSHGTTVFQQQSAGFPGSMAEEELSPACVAWKKELQQDLESIKRVCDFAVHKIYNHFANPGLEIDGCLVPLPPTPLFANQIKAVAKPASFSRHGSNVEDYSASFIWQLDHDQFRIANPSLSAFVESIKQGVAQGLGLALSDIDFEPDKLLLTGTDLSPGATRTRASLQKSRDVSSYVFLPSIQEASSSSSAPERMSFLKRPLIRHSISRLFLGTPVSLMRSQR